MEDLEQIRYFFEHKLLPKWIAEDSEGIFISDLFKYQGQVLYGIMSKICKDENIALSYTPKDYSVTLTSLTEEKSFLTLTMPEPKRMLACRRVYILFTSDFSTRKYITIEKDTPFDYICGWNMNNGQELHANYGPCPQNIQEEVAKVITLF